LGLHVPGEATKTRAALLKDFADRPGGLVRKSFTPIVVHCPSPLHVLRDPKQTSAGSDRQMT
jgi:hypothetical protein